MMNAQISLAPPRLAPIDRPRSWFVRLFDWLMRRRLGKSMTTSHVVYARMPGLLWRTLPFYHLLERGLSIDRTLRHVVEVKVSLLNGCSFCTDLHRAEATRAGVARPVLDALVSGDVAALPPATRAVLAYLEEIAANAVSDDTFAALRAHFSERQVVELTWLSAFVTYLNRMATPLGIGADGFCALQAAG